MLAREMIFFPLAIIVIIGLFYNYTYPDFPDIPEGGAISEEGYQGCISTCEVTALSIFQGTVFAPLLNGDVIGFMSNLFTSQQSIVSVFSSLAGVFMLFLSLGIGGSFTIFGTGVTISINEGGTKLVQMLGLGLILWGAVAFFFGGWFDALGWGVGTTLQTIFITMYIMGLFFEAKSQNEM